MMASLSGLLGSVVSTFMVLIIKAPSSFFMVGIATSMMYQSCITNINTQRNSIQDNY